MAAALGALGCVVIDSDQLNHEVLETGAVRARLREWWGDSVFSSTGAVARDRIAKIIFADQEQKQRLEALVHPLIADARRDRINKVAADPTVRAIVLDSPLLLESQLDRLCDSIIFVDASTEVRLARLQAARNWDEAQLRRREQWQLPPEYKRSRADFVIDNNGTEEELLTQVAAVLQRIDHRR